MSAEQSLAVKMYSANDDAVTEELFLLVGSMPQLFRLCEVTKTSVPQCLVWSF